MERWVRSLALVLTLVLVAAACSDGGDTPSRSDDAPEGAAIDYEAIGLWDDGPCDEQRPPLVVGLMTVFESPALSLGDNARALEAAAQAFNARGGANGACVEVHTCDDGANVDQSVACVRENDEAGVVVTINDIGTAGQAEVAEAMSEAGIPRIAANVTPSDWADPNVFPIDSGATGSTFLGPQALVEEGVTEIALVRVGQAAAAALIGLLEDLYANEGVTFPVDLPVPAGTTDFGQFILAAQEGRGRRRHSRKTGPDQGVRAERPDRKSGPPGTAFEPFRLVEARSSALITLPRERAWAPPASAHLVPSETGRSRGGRRS